jgi:hypothetical protein
LGAPEIVIDLSRIFVLFHSGDSLDQKGHSLIRYLKFLLIYHVITISFTKPQVYIKMIYGSNQIFSGFSSVNCTAIPVAATVKPRGKVFSLLLGAELLLVKDLVNILGKFVPRLGYVDFNNVCH